MSALLPDCPTCGGTGEVLDPAPLQTVGVSFSAPMKSCPDCIDGKVSIEQLVATWRAVHIEEPASTSRDIADYLGYLRSVKP